MLNVAGQANIGRVRGLGVMLAVKRVTAMLLGRGMWGGVVISPANGLWVKLLDRNVKKPI